jgi:hypothetical protein
MPNRALLVRPGRVRVEILEPLEAAPRGARTVDELRRETRRRIAARLEEPDLAPEQTGAG